MPCLSLCSVVVNVLHDLSIRQCDNCSKLVLGYECLSGVCVWRLPP